MMFILMASLWPILYMAVTFFANQSLSEKSHSPRSVTKTAEMLPSTLWVGVPELSQPFLDSKGLHVLTWTLYIQHQDLRCLTPVEQSPGCLCRAVASFQPRLVYESYRAKCSIEKWRQGVGYRPISVIPPKRWDDLCGHSAPIFLIFPQFSLQPFWSQHKARLKFSLHFHS